jgi:FkbM family methyltransferase
MPNGLRTATVDDMLGRLAAALAWRIDLARRRLRHAWYQDRAWIGRLVALTGNRLTIEGCQFTLDHPLVTDEVRCRMLRNRYEGGERQILRSRLDPAAPVLELGGGLGVVATLVNKRLVHPERHVVVEANPSLLGILERNRQLNAAAFSVRHAALNYSRQPTITFRVGRDFRAGRVGQAGEHEYVVPAVTLRELLDQPWWQDATLICDIEGAETELVRQDAHLLARHFRTLVFEIHPEYRSSDECAAMVSRLREAGFEPVAQVRKVHAFRKGATGASAGPPRS